MATKITREIIESYLHCTYKAHLQLLKQHGTKSAYEVLRAELQGAVRCRAIERISVLQQDTARDLPLSLATLRRGKAFLLDITLENDQASLVFDGLKRVDGPSRLGDFHYIPVLFSESRRIHKPHRLLLDLCAFLLARMQGRMPSSGIMGISQHGV
ncbi:MAG: hypothetical protein HOP18_15520 [Deltaproteobacteria bacterium]|nr:hypothetical protein [Deltaproteobacteria bacterium]